jgi:hypothetical protein
MAKKPAKPAVKVKDIDTRKNPKGGATKKIGRRMA